VTDLDLPPAAAMARAEVPSTVPIPIARPLIGGEQKQESRVPAPAEPGKSDKPAKQKLASREPAAARVKPKRERHEVNRRARSRDYASAARRARHHIGKQEAKFTPFPLFVWKPMLPGGRIAPTSQ
jgi:hypothetical protein